MATASRRRCSCSHSRVSSPCSLRTTMNRWWTRIALFGVVSLVTLSGWAAAGSAVAQAQPFSQSAITKPANGSILFYDGDQGAGSVTVEGTITPAEQGDGNLLCYTSSPTPIDVADGIAVSAAGSFAATIPLSAIHGQACVLRFVPPGTTPTPSVAAASFTGPEAASATSTPTRRTGRSTATTCSAARSRSPMSSAHSASVRSEPHSRPIRRPSPATTCSTGTHVCWDRAGSIRMRERARPSRSTGSTPTRRRRSTP